MSPYVRVILVEITIDDTQMWPRPEGFPTHAVRGVAQKVDGMHAEFLCTPSFYARWVPMHAEFHADVEKEELYQQSEEMDAYIVIGWWWVQARLAQWAVGDLSGGQDVFTSTTYNPP